jgi:hypothetical protein
MTMKCYTHLPSSEALAPRWVSFGGSIKYCNVVPTPFSNSASPWFPPPKKKKRGAGWGGGAQRARGNEINTPRRKNRFRTYRFAVFLIVNQKYHKVKSV